MNPKAKSSWSSLQLLGLAFLLMVASCIFHLKAARAGTPLHRDQHLGAAIDYYKTKIDLLRPIIVGFNATGTPTPLELPVWQAAAALAFKIMGPWYGWANVVSLLLFFPCLFPLYALTKSHVSERCACWTLVFFLAQPLIFIYAGLASPDGFSMAVSIWFLYFAVKLVETQRLIWWLPSIAVGALAAVSKLPFFMSAGLVCFFLLVSRYRNSLRAWLLLASSGGVIVALFFLWTAHTNRCIAEAQFPLVDLRISNNESAFWYFGDLHYRLVPGNWLKGGWRILNSCFGSFALVGMCLYGICFARDSRFAKLILLAGAVTTLVFTHLVLHHSHYYLMFTPAFAILCALTMVEWEKNLPLDQPWKAHVMFSLIAAVLGLSIVQGFIGMKTVLYFDPYPYDIAKVIDKYSTPNDKLLIQGGGWGGEELFLSDRKGLSIWGTKFLEDPATLDILKKLGYNKLVMISESPLLTALQKINPGEARLERVTYRSALTDVARNWPVLLQTDDILIKDIP